MTTDTTDGTTASEANTTEERLSFGDVRSALEAALEDPRRLDAVVWCCLNNPVREEREVWWDYASGKLRTVPHLQEVVDWARAEEEAILARAEELQDAVRRDGEPEDAFISAMDVRWFLAAVAWARACDGPRVMVARLALFLDYDGEALKAQYSTPAPLDPGRPYIPMLGTGCIYQLPEGVEPWTGVPERLVPPAYLESARQGRTLAAQYSHHPDVEGQPDDLVSDEDWYDDAGDWPA